MIKEFCKFIESKTSFTVGSTIQVGWRPQTAPDRCSVVMETIGGSQNYDLPDRIDKPFSIISRSTRGKLASQDDARDDALEIFNALTGNVAGVLKSAQWALPVVDGGPSYVAETIEAMNDPTYIGQDEEGRFEYSTNYLVRLRIV